MTDSPIKNKFSSVYNYFEEFKEDKLALELYNREHSVKSSLTLTLI